MGDSTSYKRAGRSFPPPAGFLFFLLFGLFGIGRQVSSSPSQVIAACLLQGLSFAIFLPAARLHVSSLAPEGLKTTAQTVAMAFYFGVGGILSSFFGGIFIDARGIKSLLLVGLAISLVATSFMLFLILKAALASDG